MSLEDQPDESVHTLGLGKRVLLTVLAGSLLGGCTASRPAIMLSGIPAAISSQQQENLDRHRRDVEERIVGFSPVVFDEYRDGSLKLEFKVTSNEILNAHYDREEKKLTLECGKDFTSCYTSATEHELGHHIDESIPKKDLWEAYRTIERRLEEPDAEHFHEGLRLLKEEGKRLSKLFMEVKRPLNKCKRFIEDIEMDQNLLQQYLHFGLEIVENHDKYGLSQTDMGDYSLRQALAYLKKGEAAFHQSFPDCTESEVERRESIVASAEKQIRDRIRTVYHSNEVGPRDNSPELNLDQLKSGIFVNSGEVVKTYSGGYVAVFDLLIDIISRVDPALGHQLEEKVKEKLLISLRRGARDSRDRTRMMEESASLGFFPQHDERSEELFAAAVDSLYQLYDGPVVTGPLLFKLDDPILDSLVGIEYKSERIFVSQVEKYRKIVLVAD